MSIIWKLGSLKAGWLGVQGQAKLDSAFRLVWVKWDLLSKNESPYKLQIYIQISRNLHITKFTLKIIRKGEKNLFFSFGFSRKVLCCCCFVLFCGVLAVLGLVLSTRLVSNPKIHLPFSRLKLKEGLRHHVQLLFLFVRLPNESCEYRNKNR